jgi:hypothetical protein
MWLAIVLQRQRSAQSSLGRPDDIELQKLGPGEEQTQVSCSAVELSRSGSAGPAHLQRPACAECGSAHRTGAMEDVQVRLQGGDWCWHCYAAVTVRRACMVGTQASTCSVIN